MIGCELCDCAAKALKTYRWQDTCSIALLLNMPVTSSQHTSLLRRSESFTAHIRIASQQNPEDPLATDEVLSFGAYPFANTSFQRHASLNANPNGTLAVKATDVQLLPAGGSATIGCGKQCRACHTAQCTAPHMVSEGHMHIVF